MTSIRLVLLVVLTTMSALASTLAAANMQLAERHWMVDRRQRLALIHAPPEAKTQPTPVVFAFHGHGGTAAKAAGMFHIQDLWPEALVVYMEGVPTPAKLVDQAGKRSGWQVQGGEFGDRDLHFFDAVLSSLRRDYRVDDARIFATGHSHGGVFTYCLWAERGDVLAAVAPSAANTPPENFAKLKPKPVMHAAGVQDDLVKFAWQQDLIGQLIKLNGCSPEGQKFGPRVTRYSSPDHDTPVLTYIHDGGHAMPAEEPAAIVRFFKSRAARVSGQGAAGSGK